MIIYRNNVTVSNDGEYRLATISVDERELIDSVIDTMRCQQSEVTVTVPMTLRIHVGPRVKRRTGE